MVQEWISLLQHVQVMLQRTMAQKDAGETTLKTDMRDAGRYSCSRIVAGMQGQTDKQTAGVR